MTVNVPLWPRTTVLFANEQALGKLTDEQQGWIRQAAADAMRYSLTTFGEDQRIVQSECRNGMKAVISPPALLNAFRKAFTPVYASLRKDATTAKMITKISALKTKVAAVPLAVPKGCLAPIRSTSSANPQAAFPEGVYRFKRSRQDVLRVWPNADEATIKGLSGTLTFTFKQGVFRAVLAGGGTPGCRRGEGRYSVKGADVTAQWTTFHGCPFFHAPSAQLRLRWAFDGKILRFRLAHPAPASEHVTWESNPFVRIG